MSVLSIPINIDCSGIQARSDASGVISLSLNINLKNLTLLPVDAPMPDQAEGQPVQFYIGDDDAEEGTPTSPTVDKKIERFSAVEEVAAQKHEVKHLQSIEELAPCPPQAPQAEPGKEELEDEEKMLAKQCATKYLKELLISVTNNILAQQPKELAPCPPQAPQAEPGKEELEDEEKMLAKQCATKYLKELLVSVTNNIFAQQPKELAPGPKAPQINPSREEELEENQRNWRCLRDMDVRWKAVFNRPTDGSAKGLLPKGCCFRATHVVKGSQGGWILKLEKGGYVPTGDLRGNKFCEVIDAELWLAATAAGHSWSARNGDERKQRRWQNHSESTSAGRSWNEWQKSGNETNWHGWKHGSESTSAGRSWNEWQKSGNETNWHGWKHGSESTSAGRSWNEWQKSGNETNWHGWKHGSEGRAQWSSWKKQVAGVLPAFLTSAIDKDEKVVTSVTDEEWAEHFRKERRLLGPE